MRIELQTDGGVAFFPGLSRPIVVDTASLPAERAAHLRQLVDAAHFFEMPAAARSLPKGAADIRRYTITVQDGQRSHTVRLLDPIEDANAQALIDFVQGQRKSQSRDTSSSTPSNTK